MENNIILIGPPGCGKSTVLSRFHNLAFTRSLIIDAAQVQYTMYDGAVKFLIVSCGKLLTIGTYRIEADEEIATDGIVLRVVEGNDIGIVVVLQVLAVHLEYALIIAKYVVHIAHVLAIGGSHSTDPCRSRAFLDVWHTYAISLIGNHF